MTLPELFWFLAHSVVEILDTVYRWLPPLLIVVLLSGCASSGAYHTAQIGFIGANVADWDSTRRALAIGYVERNPLLPTSPLPLALVKTAQTAAVLWLCDHIQSKGHRQLATTLLAVGATAIGLIAANNYRLVR